MAALACELSPRQLLEEFVYPVIPSGGGKSGKAPLVAWEQYQTEFPTPEDLERWEQQLRPSLWGIVTGEVSSIVIVDVDRPELRKMLDNAGLLPHIETPRGGFHYWFRHPGHYVKTVASLLPGIDIRGDGGFVNVIGKRQDGEYKVLISPSPDAIYPWDKLPPEIVRAMNGCKPGPSPVLEQPIFEGERNARLTSLAGSMRAKGLSQGAIEAALQAINSQSCQPPLTEGEVLAISKSVARYSPTSGNKEYLFNTLTFPAPADTERDKIVTENVTKSDAQTIRVWISESNGWFSYEECDKDLGIRDTKRKDNRRQVFKRLRDEGIIEQHPRSNKLFRAIRADTRLIDFKRCGNKVPLAVRYPFGIEKLYNTYPGNLIVIAGDADAGKTAFLLNLIRLNMDDFPIYYQSSEMGDMELASRLEKFDGLSLEDWNFTAEERTADLADVTRPDCINVYDYLEFEGGKYYEIADHLRAIHQRLSTGIAVVAIQKKRKQDVGRGGDLGLEKPRLYLSMSAGQLTVVKAKNWADPEVNPKGLTLTFKIVNGCRFIVEKDWHKQDE